MASQRPEYLGEPTLGQVMRRPQWILALLLALLIAGVFAWLGRWQLGSAIRTDTDQLADTETVRELVEVAPPDGGLTEFVAGSVVELSARIVPEDFSVVEERMNGDVLGAWVVGRVDTGDPAGALSVAFGWAPTASAAEAAIPKLESAIDPNTVLDLEGRIMPAEAPNTPRADEDPMRVTAMVPAAQVNLWGQVEVPLYTGYLVLHPEGETGDLIHAATLDAIDSVPPSAPEAVNWLNLFYAIEWVVFAGFAVFFWFRLTRDAWEKEHELKQLHALAEATTPTRDE